MKIVESKLVTVMSEGFYGSVSNNAIIEVDRGQFSQDKLEIGTVLQSLCSDSQPIYAHVAEILRICTGYSLYCSFVYEKNE